MGTRPQSTRRHAWRVQPLSESTGTPACTSHGSRQTILCGYLFNAHAERCALGLGVGEGEECCITLEPIADARLSFSDKILVSSFHPSLTGVELLCGHRFSAVNLLWHWCMSPMVCPMCRAPYMLHVGSEPNVPTSSSLENFPQYSWRQLRAILTETRRERNLEAERENQAAIVNAVMNDVMETVFAPIPEFFVMFSFERPGSPPDHHSIRLRQRNPGSDVLTEESLLSFSVPRAATRYLSRLLHTAGCDIRRGEVAPRVTALILAGVGRTANGVCVMLPVTQFTSHVLPLTPGVDSAPVANEGVDSAPVANAGVDSMNGAPEGVMERTHEDRGVENTSLMVERDVEVMDITGGESFQAEPDIISSVDGVSVDVPGMSIMRMVSTDLRGEIVLDFFRSSNQREDTLVSIEVSVEAFSALAFVAHHIVHDARARMI